MKRDSYEAECLDCGAFYVTFEMGDAWEWIDEHEAGGEQHVCRMIATIQVVSPRGRTSSRRAR